MFARDALLLILPRTKCGGGGAHEVRDGGGPLHRYAVPLPQTPFGGGLLWCVGTPSP
jgi:hypothetical protein